MKEWLEIFQILSKYECGNQPLVPEHDVVYFCVNDLKTILPEDLARLDELGVFESNGQLQKYT